MITSLHLLWALALTIGLPSQSSVLIVSGQNNHDWERTVAHLERTLQDADIFSVHVTLTPDKEADQDTWEDWDPAFDSYDVVLLAYNGELWPERVRKSFEEYVSGGGSVLVQHAANNAFPGWDAYEAMVGLLWRGKDAGYGAYWDEKQGLTRVAPGEDRGAGHGRLHHWTITTRDPEHSIMAGLPEMWLHPFDELYHGQRGPAEGMNVLATAWSDTESGGTGRHELMVWWIEFGEGKVLTFLPGHLWGGQEDDRALRCVGFRTLLQRSAEWLATGEVTLPVPENFPTAEQIEVVSE
ncbi:MAG: ThuA domain-containing protein [Bacteroidota bacterium]|nr:ThuA domain-containing protein [Bacteroidota bacterium]MXW14929.1 ThuA domain-containing protein [Rhodothermaceae bacterium]MDE2646616.1 ThuA domain-containing protein [Bacteroidota bacterium]MXW33085.1 ThuA domain-containing protein [Rhodothermaceae bacterium]MXZ17616.1 ThuA domain-containing protein [Rhodothermaceae bacterium]